jgi:hypothetical protein
MPVKGSTVRQSAAGLGDESDNKFDEGAIHVRAIIVTYN